jgi:protein-S-isoprenylcysteine O-methyltransferase Ste14
MTLIILITRINYISLITGTIIILLFSWFYSIKHRRYHGIPRLIVFESIFILFLLNWRYWFRDPFSPVQILSWILLIISAYAGIAGFLLLKTKGRPEEQFENTTRLVTSGIYGYIRHPLYLSLLTLGTGIMLKDPGLIQYILGAVILVSVYFTAVIEEKEMSSRFNGEYRVYMEKTTMFIPFII